MSNETLSKAKAVKKGEFYTQLIDIKKMVRCCWRHFEGRVWLGCGNGGAKWFRVPFTCDNYDVINVDRVTDVLNDLEGEMGVPITFIDKHNSDQFEIIGLDGPLMFALAGKVRCIYLGGQEIGSRIVIRRK